MRTGTPRYGPRRSKGPQSYWCCVGIRFGLLMAQDHVSKTLNRNPQNKGTGQRQNRRQCRRTFKPKREKWWKNRHKRAPHPTARFLESWFPSISNDVPTVASAWWNVLAVEECVLSPQARASSGSKRTPERRAADSSDRETLVGHRKNRLGCCRRVDPHLKSRGVVAIASDVHVIR